MWKVVPKWEGPVERYDDEQVSRILSLAAVRQLGPPHPHGPDACIEQAALATFGVWASANSRAWDHDRQNTKGVRLTPTQALRWLQKHGMY